jgi:hypothetical protein
MAFGTLLWESVILTSFTVLLCGILQELVPRLDSRYCGLRSTKTKKVHFVKVYKIVKLQALINCYMKTHFNTLFYSTGIVLSLNNA